MTASQTASLIGIDWGTSNMRLWVFDAQGNIIANAQCDKGMSSLTSSDYEPTIKALLSPFGATISGLQDVPYIICGMAGAATGWQEAGYLSVPTALTSLADEAIEVQAAEAKTYIIPGIAQREEQQPDVMRGEETLLYGACLSQGLTEAQFCLPGTHAKWVTMRDSCLTAFTTFMTGELYNLLMTHSILGPVLAKQKGDDTAFYEGVVAGAKAVHPLSAALFSTRASALLFPGSHTASQAYLSGLLIGHESAAYQESDLPLYVIASSDMAIRYQKALTYLAIPHHVIDADEAAQCALWQIGKDIKERRDG